MEKLIKIGDSFVSKKDKRDDDFADRINSKLTVYILVAFCMLNMFRGYVGKPITCWGPKHFTGSHMKYTNSYCWVRNTYYLPWEEEVPAGGDDTPRQMVTYYQWVPFILLFQAVLFYFPSFVWHTLNQKAGVDCDSILESAYNLSVLQKLEKYDHTLALVTNQIRWFLRAPRSGGKGEEGRCGKCACSWPPAFCRLCCGKRFGNYLVILFLISKALYIVNVVTQFFWLNKLLNFEFHAYGWRYLVSGDWDLENHQWTQLEEVPFPRVTMCDVDVRRLGNVHPYAVQCALPINLFNEKMYIFLWFWFVFVAAMSVLNFVIWLSRFLWPKDRVAFIKNHLRGSGLVRTQEEKYAVRGFVTDYLKQDGVLLMRLLAHNVGGITAQEVCTELYRRWREDNNLGSTEKLQETELS